MFPVLMAGGRARRFGSQKLLLEICGFPLFYWPLLSLKEVFDRVYVAYTSHAEEIRNYKDAFGFIPIKTSGASYPDDIRLLLEIVGSPILTLVADSVFISPRHIDKMVSSFSGKSASAVVKFNDGVFYTGLNIVVKGSLANELVYLEDLPEPLSINTYYDLKMVRERIWRDGCYLSSRL